MRAASDFWELWYKPHFITTIGPLKIVDRRFSCDQNSEGISNLRAIRGRGDRLVLKIDSAPCQRARKQPKQKKTIHIIHRSDTKKKGFIHGALVVVVATN